MSNITEGFVFNHLNCPAEILARTSRRFFVIEREKTENVANFSPAVLKVLSRNGVRVNNKLIPQYGSIILKTGDSIRLPNNTLMFQFFDDRDFNKKGVPDCILRKYHLAGSLGQGGQSSVRLLHRFDLNGKFAMKIISKDRFESESSFAHQKRLQHMLNEVRLALLFNFPYFNFSFFRSTLCENFIIPTLLSLSSTFRPFAICSSSWSSASEEICYTTFIRFATSVFQSMKPSFAFSRFAMVSSTYICGILPIVIWKLIIFLLRPVVSSKAIRKYYLRLATSATASKLPIFWLKSEHSATYHRKFSAWRANTQYLLIFGRSDVCCSE